ncbi:efflux transporter outer membrane subunit [Croceicoccus mobilis]|uniref:RND transporter n=1 Tax=Croceicoccus mobilis TaxID=1703339 RepID=A0A917DTJ6_9SPHN|nr:efflux transporter outer membrane subunit [Croceicoccus mobilis]GGD65751.1 RND transporter [Croceicoccus mobilis]
MQMADDAGALMHFDIARKILPAFAAVLLASCTTLAPEMPHDAQALALPEDWSVEASGETPDLVRWWQAFDDPVLTGLIEQSLEANTDLGVALSRLRQAREALVVSRSSLFPSLSAAGGYNRQESIRGGGTTVTLPDGTVTTVGGGGSDSFSLGLDASYQLDIFGGNRSAVRASRADLEAAGFDYASTMRLVESEVARNYILARAYQSQLANARASLAIQDDNLEIAGYRVMAGLVSSVDEEQARSSRAQSAASVPQIGQQYNAAVSRLGVLTGQAPGAVKPIMEAVQPIPTGPSDPGAGIPADLLRRRPDIRSAERQLEAAAAQIGVARAALLPTLSISGSLDTNATSFSRLFDTITSGLFAGISQSLFAGGRLAAQARQAEAAADGAFASYRGTVLTALEDVENAVTALRAARERETLYEVALDAANNSAIYARAQYQSGLTDFTTLNAQEIALISARNGLVQAQSDRANALVALYDALGGGWDPEGNPAYDPPIEGPAEISPGGQD